jgi:hypothetical protein
MGGGRRTHPFCFPPFCEREGKRSVKTDRHISSQVRKELLGQASEHKGYSPFRKRESESEFPCRQSKMVIYLE